MIKNDLEPSDEYTAAIDDLIYKYTAEEDSPVAPTSLAEKYYIFLS